MKEPSRGRKNSQPREKRSGGFKRKQTPRAKDIDELLESGADAEETAGAPDAEEESAPAPAPKGRGVSLGRRPKATEPEESAEPEAPMEAGPEEEPEEPAPRRTSFGSKQPKKQQTAKITVSAPGAAEPKAKRGKTPKPPKAEKPAKGFGRKKAQEEPEDEAPVMPKGMKGGKQPKPPKPPRPTAGPKQPKPSRKAKVQTENDFAENMAPQGPVVLVKPESIGSQLLSLIEVIAGGCIAFFGATQVGNILINKIVSMM